MANPKTGTQQRALSSASDSQREVLQNIIDELFATFKIAYPGQFERHYKDVRILGVTKKLWYRQLKHTHPDTIKEASHTIIAEKQYLPTVSEFLQKCRNTQQLPPAEEAWRMAMNLAPSEGQVKDTTVPVAVVRAARITGWDTLLELDVKSSLKIFSYNYAQLLRRIAAGEDLSIPEPTAIEAPPPLAEEKSLKHLREIRKAIKV